MLCIAVALACVDLADKALAHPDYKHTSSHDYVTQYRSLSSCNTGSRSSRCGCTYTSETVTSTSRVKTERLTQVNANHATTDNAIPSHRPIRSWRTNCQIAAGSFMYGSLRGPKSTPAAGVDIPHMRTVSPWTL